MRRVIGMDIHRTFAEVMFWQDGRLRWHGRVDMTRAGLEGVGRSLTKTDEVVLEATGNPMAVVRLLRPYVGWMEGIHGEAKTWHGLGRAVRRGLANMQIQAYLTAAVINLKRLAAVVLSTLMALWTRPFRSVGSATLTAP